MHSLCEPHSRQCADPPSKQPSHCITNTAVRGETNLCISPKMTIYETPVWGNAKEIKFSRREKWPLQNIKCHFSTRWIISLINLLFSLVKFFYPFFTRQNMTQRNTVNAKLKYDLYQKIILSISMSQRQTCTHNQPWVYVWTQKVLRWAHAFFSPPPPPKASRFHPVSGSSHQTTPSPPITVFSMGDKLGFSVQWTLPVSARKI